MPFLGSGLLAFLSVIAESSQCVDSVILYTLSQIAGMTLVHKQLWTPGNGFKVIPAIFACSEPAQTPDMALRINHFQERKAERMRQERNRGNRLNRHPKHPDYKVYNREISGQYRGPQVICRTANFPRRARRGV